MISVTPERAINEQRLGPKSASSFSSPQVMNMNCILQEAVHLLLQLQDRVGCAQKNVALVVFPDLTQDLNKAQSV